ncbi:long-chain-fatty-acid--CoA ligase [Mesorhizobium sp. CAU 1741]|uniref:long-chain-fatty-acid--CoA ligase n=1 Tax=Mesorhizobium sp. CAU 1741 TaxID=3140366 RepID=UPI00325B654D
MVKTPAKAVSAKTAADKAKTDSKDEAAKLAAAAKASVTPKAKTPSPAKPKAAAKPAAAKAAPAARPKAPAAKPAQKAATKPAAAKKPAATKAAAAPKASAKTAEAPTADKAPARKTPAKSAAAPKAAKAAPAPKAAKAYAAPRTEKSAPAKTASKPAAAKKPSASAKAAAKPATPTSKAKPAATKASSGSPYASKPWLANYSDVVKPEIGKIEDASLGDMMVRSCATFSSRPAFTSMDKTLTFTQLEAESKHLAAFLQSKGLAKGARVALMMPNVLQYPVALMAVLRAGYVVVNVNPLYTPRELEHQLKDSGAEAIVILENFATTLQKVIKNTSIKHVVVASMGDMLGLKGFIVNLVVRRVKKMVPSWSLPGHVAFKDALKQGRAKSFKKPEVGPDDIAFLQYTGGTTGVSKGAVLLHRNILANVNQNALWVESAYVKRPKPDRLIYVCALPLYHIYALTVNAFMGMQQGANNVLIANPRDIPAFVKELQKYKFNVFPGLNTLFNALLNNEDFRKLDFKSLLLTFGGGMAVQRAVAERWQKLTGGVISEGYGLSETSPVATTNRFDADEFSGTIGLPIPSTEIAIRDEEGNDVPLGEVGEICIRGPQVMDGYWNRPDETAKVMTMDGFFKSGDMGFMDERGYVKIVDRKKDMILVSGFNVYPNEIEDVIAMHPGVLEVAAIGVPDEKSGEVPKVFVVKKDESLTDKDILEFCKDKLTAYKRPKHVEFRKELPKTNVGKILRRELR